MAPRPGFDDGYNSGGSSSFGYGDDSGFGYGDGGCAHCNQDLQFQGSDFTNVTDTAQFAFSIIFLVALLALLIMCCFSQWRFRGRFDGVRSLGIPWSIIGEIIYVTVIGVVTALNELSAAVSYFYNLAFVFEDFGWRLCEILLVLIIPRVVVEQLELRTSSRSLAKGVGYASYICFVLLFGLSAAGFGLETKYIVTIIVDPNPDVYSEFIGEKIDFAYQILYLVLTFVIFTITALTLYSKADVKGVRTCVICLAFAWFFRTVFATASTGLENFAPPGYIYDPANTKLQTAIFYFYNLSAIVIFAILVYLSLRRVRASTPGYYAAPPPWPLPQQQQQWYPPPPPPPQPQPPMAADPGGPRYYMHGAQSPPPQQQQQQQQFAQSYYAPGTGYPSPPPGQYQPYAPGAPVQAYEKRSSVGSEMPQYAGQGTWR